MCQALGYVCAQTETRSAYTAAKDGEHRAQHSHMLDFMHKSRKMTPLGHVLDKDQGNRFLCPKSGILHIGGVFGVLFRKGQ